jgi:hypothetical protein
VSRRVAAVGVGVLLLAAAVAWSQLGSDARVAAGPLPGVPLEGSSGLRLLVASNQAPVVVDVDTGAIRAVTGLPVGDGRSVHLEAVGEDAVVVSRRDCRGGGCAADSVAYLVRHGSTVATRLGAATDVEASRDGQGVWLLTRQDATRCTLGQVGLDGRPRRPPRPAPCDAVLIDELPAGLLVYGTRPGDGSGPYSALVAADGAFRRLPRVVDGVAAGDLVVSTVERGRLIDLTDLRGGASHRLSWPSTLEDHVMGLIEGHPDGQVASVAFYPPAAAPSRPWTCGCWTSPAVAGGGSPTCRCGWVPASPSCAGPPTAAWCSWPTLPASPRPWSPCGDPASHGSRLAGSSYPTPTGAASASYSGEHSREYQLGGPCLLSSTTPFASACSLSGGSAGSNPVGATTEYRATRPLTWTNEGQGPSCVPDRVRSGPAPRHPTRPPT